MRIESDIKLDFSDVLIRPKRSTLVSRKQVSLERTYSFRNSRQSYTGIPIMASNMDGVGTFEMAEALASHGMFTCLTKHYPIEDINDWIVKNPQNWAYSLGVTHEDKLKFENLKIVPDYLCIDVANGYLEIFVNMISEYRERYPDVTIIAGNVVTGEMTEELILNGADIVKVGIGPGCFAPGQKVKTEKGLKNIEDINKDEKVLTHTGAYKTVTNTFRFDDKKSIINVNGIKATSNHEFYVLHKKHKEIVTDDNIHQYAEWIEAKELTTDYLLLKHK